MSRKILEVLAENLIVQQDKVYTKIDGLSIFSDNWNFLKPLKNVYIKFPQFVEYVNPVKEFNGSVVQVKNKAAYKVKLFDVNDMVLSLIFLSNNRFESYTTITGIVAKALAQTFENVCGTETCRQNIQNIDCEFNTKGESVNKCIYVCDFDIVGRKFSHYLHLLCEEEALSYFFHGYSFGQCAKLSSFLFHLEHSLNVNKANEVIIHLAMDSLNSNHIKFWNREELVKVMNRNPSYEYFPTAIPGHGNFYFTNPMKPAGNRVISSIKFYNEINKHVHNHKIQPFKRSSIGDFLWSESQNLLQTKFKPNQKIAKSLCSRFLRQTELLKRLQNLDSHPYYCRLEFVISLRNPNMNIVCESIKQALIFTLKKKVFEVPCVSLVSKDVVSHRLQQYFEPIHQILLQHLNNLNEFLYVGKPYLGINLGWYF